jgi:osmotically-inducible protein OsmY
MKRFVLLAAAVAAVGCGQSGRTLGEHIDDGWVATKTRLHLMQHGFGRQMNVNIDVDRGVVTVKGEARSEADKAKVEELVRQVVGVRDVRNELRIVPEPEMEQRAEAGRRWQNRRASRTSY